MLILLCVFLACRATPMEPGVSLRPPLTPSVAAEQGCARLDVRVKGRETITVEDDTVEVSAGGACGGLQPVINGIPEFDRTTNRVRLPVALNNNGTSPVQAPARLYGWEDSLTVIEAPGLAQNEWTASYLDFVAPDSALADTAADFPGALLWRYDTLLAQGGLAVGATSGARWIELAVHSGVQRFEVVLHAEAAGVIRNPVPIEPPDSIPAWVFADSNVVDSSAYISGAFLKNILIVRFRRGTTQAERQAAIDTVGGAVVGGVRFGFIEGDYVVRVNDPGDGSQLLAAADLLMSLPQVRKARIEVKIHYHYLRPDDGEQWAQWQLTPQAADGQNSALEAIAAPLAWGCETGDLDVPVGIIDGGFQDLAEIMDNATLSHGLFTGPTGRSHGTNVASILGAKGNNEELMTGVMWNASMQLYDARYDETGVDEAGDWLLNGSRLLSVAAKDNQMVINMSLGQGQWHHRPDSARTSDLALVTPYILELSSNLADLREVGLRPLVVLSAGNETLDAFWSAFPAVNDSVYGDQVVVVGGSTIQHQRWAGSNTGHLIDVYAPAEGVYRLSGAGDGVAPGSGTSFSAPLVTGIAGLMLSMDSTLTAAELKEYIVEGARRGGIQIDGKYVANAYESLKLVGQRMGAPLCGTHVWTANGQLLARRASGVEVLANLGDAAGLVNVRHGGRRVDLVGDQTSSRSFLYDQTSRNWSEASDPFALPDTLHGGTYLSSLFVSHGLDSTVRVLPFTSGSQTTFTLQIFDIYDRVWRPLTTVHATVIPPSGEGECIREAAADSTLNYQCTATLATGTWTSVYARPAFSPLSDRILLAVNREQHSATVSGAWVRCPGAMDLPGTSAPASRCRGRTQHTQGLDVTLYEIRFADPLLPRILGGFGNEIFWLGISEDGREIVTGEGSHTNHLAINFDETGMNIDGSYETFTGCKVVYRSSASLALTATEPSPEACEFESGGTISPSIMALNKVRPH